MKQNNILYVFLLVINPLSQKHFHGLDYSNFVSQNNGQL